ncbi:pilus assembly protein TadG-related protein [Tropicibacter oceani]|uniref:Pilus assembly protein TadG-related protein n=1 Tax=Tropicibacter oceani TaxID=3058420 RepID=A0ABY8QGT3_9RHOB|nr:pilus assembly protein TadG-related protein [Tropicibacter oceani]WGW03847.1 pilus assembly protein TadG-related protein [Tropicibacter oceani]
MKMVLNALKEGAKLPAPATASASGGWLGRFWADESGSMSYFAVAGALVMMVFGGIGIDMIHAELKRNKVQNTLDRAVLAAANVDNEMDPTTTVQEYFSAMGMADALQSVEVTEGTGRREVKATGHVTMPSNLMGLIGVDTLQADGAATALNGIGNIEISLVLDVSGSMSGTKIEQLKTAAKSFVDTLIPADATDTLISISLVPYNATVNMGEDLASYFNLEDAHPFSYCATFSASDYGTPAVNTIDQLTQIGHFDPYSGGITNSSPWCPTGDTSRIVPHSSDPEFLKAQIDALTANGNTAIDLGVKWGASLLDPSARPIIDSMVSSGAMDTLPTPRPAAYTDSETLKFIVVMTDGQNTSQYDLKDARKYGMSNVWVDDHGTADMSDDRYSIKLIDRAGDSNDLYLWTHLKNSNPSGAFKSTPYSWTLNDPLYNVTNTVASTVGNAIPNANALANANCNASFLTCAAQNLYHFTRGGGPRQMENIELHARLKTAAVGNEYYWFAYSKGKITYQQYLDAYYAYEVIQNDDQADSNLSSVCSAAKSEGVVIYAIGVEAPSRGLAAMRDCASSPAHYFDVQGSDLDSTFSQIARTLQTLRLIQ